MALRPIDNALPITPERPKKYAKMMIPAQKEKQEIPAAKGENNLPKALPEDASIDYVQSADLEPLQDLETTLEDIVGGLESKDWLKVCESLNDVRRLAIHHSDRLEPHLENVVPVLVRSIKNPRSALCKTSLMAASDIFRAFGNNLIHTDSESFNQLLLQLLLKASQDKKFVCEEANRTLSSMVESTSPLPLLNQLSPYVSHSNLRVRAKAAMSISKCVSKLDRKGMEEFGFVELIKTSANLLNDKLPEAREAARSIGLEAYGAITETEEEKEKLWQNFCQNNLPAVLAQAMLKLAAA
ncbi:hypothetical protein M569_13958, partial [Genlisea aurea]